MVSWNSRLIALIRDGLTGLSNVDLVCELLGPLPYRDVLNISRMNKRIWNSCRTELQLSRLIMGKEVDRFIRRFGDKSLTLAVLFKNVRMINGLLDRGYDPSLDMDYVLRWASNNGWVAIVERLLLDSRVNPASCRNCAIAWASQEGQLEVVKRLLLDGRVDPSYDSNWAIKEAIRNGHTEVVQLLLSDSRVASTYTVTT